MSHETLTPAAAAAEQARLTADTLKSAFLDCLDALEELGHEDAAERLRARWPEAAGGRRADR